MSAPRLVGLVGLSGAGKDTVALRMRERWGYHRVAIADPIKAAVVGLFRLDHDQLWGERRNVVDPWLGIAPRELFASFGKACTELDPDVWLRPFLERVRHVLDHGGNVVCTDVRTAREAAALRAIGGELWWRERPGDRPGAAEDGRRIAAELGGHAFERTLVNDGEVEELWGRVDGLVGPEP